LFYNKKETDMKNAEFREFIDYVISFYGIGGIYARFFTDAVVERAEVEFVYSECLKHNEEWWSCADSMCRELMRDILLVRRGSTDTEFSLPNYKHVVPSNFITLK
jgi:hypothetical protein